MTAQKTPADIASELVIKWSKHHGIKSFVTQGGSEDDPARTLPSEIAAAITARDAEWARKLEAEKTTHDKIMDAGFDHPCKDTCSGWEQGRMRGRREKVLAESNEWVCVGWMRSKMPGENAYCMFVNENGPHGEGGFKWEFLDYKPDDIENYSPIYIYLEPRPQIKPVAIVYPEKRYWLLHQDWNYTDEDPKDSAHWIEVISVDELRRLNDHGMGTNGETK